MQGNPRVIELLNELLTLELTAINQYFLHSRMCSNWGYERLAAKIRDQAFDEMKDAEEIIDRVLFFDGLPNVQRIGNVSIGETVTEQLELMLATESTVLDFLRTAVNTCEEVGDTATREFFAGRLEEEEGHLDFLETQLGLIRTLGEQAYLSQQLHG